MAVRPRRRPANYLTLWILRVVTRVGAAGEVGCFARVLDADKHRPLVGSGEYARNLARFWSNQETANLTCRGIGANHLVIAETGISTGIDRIGRHVGFDPKPAAWRHVNAVGGGKLVTVDRRTVGWVRGVAAEDENVPVEVWLIKIVVVFPSYDVPVSCS